MGRTLVVLFIVSLLCLGSGQPLCGSTEEEARGGSSRNGDEYPVWSDSLDDTSHVYIPPGGLVGVEVSDGEVHLLAGHDEGWVASTIITCPEGYRYDLVLIDVDMPGSSLVELSILDASDEATEVGFANATISNFVRVEATQLSVFDTHPTTYPMLRIQVNLLADGADRPRLLGWSLHFIEVDEWRDDFLTTIKMVRHQGLNFTDGAIELNLSRAAMFLEPADYNPFPPLAVPLYRTSAGTEKMSVYYSSAEGDGYDDAVEVSVNGTRHVMFEDLNGDGSLDLICSNYRWNNVAFDSQIYWGSSSGTWSREGATDLNAPFAWKVTSGDFNGDMEYDIAFACMEGDNPAAIFLNKGFGRFNHDPDIQLNPKNSRAIASGDLNSDGFDDILVGDWYNMYCYFGGGNGPDTVADIVYSTSGCSDIDIMDIDGDQYLDIVCAANDDLQSLVFLGDFNGPDNTPDFRLTVTTQEWGYIFNSEAGDFNGDGYTDLMFTRRDQGNPENPRIYIFEGNAQGWSDARRHEIEPPTFSQSLKVFDVNKDGCDDIMAGYGGFVIFYGGSTWPQSPDVTFHDYSATDIAVAVPRNVGSKKFAGTFVTDTITLPYGKKWDLLHMDGTLPQNTSVEVTVLNPTGNPARGFSRVPSMDIDLSNITMDRQIKLKVTILSELNDTTPVLDSLMVKWIDVGTWSERFYGMAKIVDLSGLDIRDGELQRAQESGGPESGSYLSKAFGPDVPRDAGSFHTLRYSARLGSSQSGKLRLVDAKTSEVLAETSLLRGVQEWNLEGALSLKYHPLIQINVTAEGLDEPGEFALDDLWVNWTKRVKLPPWLISLSVSEPSVYRLQTVTMSIEVADEYDLPSELMLNVEHRLNGTITWFKYLIGKSMYNETEGVWVFTIKPNAGVAIGMYDFRVDVTDTDMLYVDNVEFPCILEVLNNLPIKPVVHIAPSGPSTTSQLRVEIDNVSIDLESAGLEYRYRWYKDGEQMTDITGDIVSPSRTARGQNWTVEVRAFDGDDESEPALAWVLIGNAAPVIDLDLPDPEFPEDTTDSDWLDLSTAFKDDDGDPLTWSLANTPSHIEVTIDPATGKVTLVPEVNWFGEVNLTFIALDGQDTASQTVTVKVNPVNDIPIILTVDGEPIKSDPMEYTIHQGDVLVISYYVADVEGDLILDSVNSSIVVHDEGARTITISPGNDQVGTLRFGLWISDDPATANQVTLNFTIIIENENDPMGDPEIMKPRNNERFKVNQTFSLIGICDDPDLVWGQVLNFSWSSSISGHLGYGPSPSLSLEDDGTHVITLTVTDGEFQRKATVTIEIEPIEDITPPPGPDGDGEEEGLSYGLVVGIILVLVVVGAVFYVMSAKRRTEEMETADEEEYKREHMERAYEAVKAAADRMEAEREEASEVKEGIEVRTDAVASTGLTIEARETEAASAKTMTLFSTPETAEPIISEEEQEQLRLDSLKRKYQNAIGRLPYGIPSKELADRDWVDLAAALATGEKKETPDGRELTEIDGRWYYSDVKDTGTFLKEHDAKPRAAERKKVELTTDKAALLAKLEERFILGEISEDAYESLKEKLEE